MEKNTAKFRSSASSLKTRVNKKLTEKYDWFRKNRINCEKEAFENSDKKDSNADRNKWHSYRNKKSPISALEMERIEGEKSPPMAVLFIESTINSELATNVRKVIQELKPWTGINVKVVERAGLAVRYKTYCTKATLGTILTVKG